MAGHIAVALMLRSLGRTEQNLKAHTGLDRTHLSHDGQNGAHGSSIVNCLCLSVQPHGGMNVT